MNKLNNKCRTCFNEFCKGLQSLTSTISDEENQQKSLAELLNEVAKINIQNDEYLNLPQAICGCCSRKLKAAHAFVQQAQEVNEKLYLMLKNSDDENKPLECLQEVQIDIGSCAEIKLESGYVYEQDGQHDINSEAEFLNTAIKFKQENDPEMDALAATLSKAEEILGDGKAIRHFLDVTYPETSDNNSNSTSSSGDEWNYDFQSTSTKSLKKKKKIKSSKKTKMNEDEEFLLVKCNDCDKIFDNSRLLSQHQRRHHVPDELKIQCKFCNAKFSQRHNMYAHMRRMHKTENLDEFQLQPRKQNVEKKFFCEQCPRSYTNKYKLIGHVDTHHNTDNKDNLPKKRTLLPKKRFLCTLCGAKCDSAGNLNIHLRRHTGENPFKCDFCDRAYPRLYDVKVHRRTHTGEKPYKCTLCEKAFIRQNKLKVHMRTHTNERPYKCTQCGKAFKQSKDLKIHQRTHTGERPYKCGVCQCTFTQSNSLRSHQVKQQHLEKPKVMENIPEDAGTALPSQ